VIGPVPASVATATELAEAEGPEAGAVVAVRADVVDLDEYRPRRCVSRDIIDVVIGQRTVVFVHLGIVPPAADQALK
jgi:hypothetical protein